MELRDFDESVRFLPNKSTTGLLGEARKAVAFKPYKERLQIARDHFLNALDYKAPRFNFLFQNSPLLFKIVYQVQTSHTWNIILILLSYIFMYLIIITHRKPQPLQQWLQFGLIAIFWFDVCMQIYHKSDKVLRQQSKFQTRFYIKILVLTLLTIDQILAMTLPNSQKFIRYFILLRCVLPVLYHSTLRKNMFALGAIYKDILVFTFFYAFVIVIFAMIANVQVQKPKNGQKYDELSQNYFSLDRALFLIYTLSSFQGFPDNQTKAIQAQPTIAIFFIVFILLNLFFFITIPSSILFKQFKDVRSKIILVGQIKQQSSLILAFACLCQHDLQIERNTFIQFLMVCFRNKPGYIDQITQIFMQIDQNRNNKVQITQFMQICKIINSHRSLYPPKFDDWQPWIQFRIYVNQRFGLKDFFLGIKYKIISSIFIVFAIVNCLLNIFCTWAIFQIIDLAVAIIFVVQLTLKLIAIGPQNYFKDPWNKLDFFISILIFTTQIIGFQDNDSNADILLKLTRAYRIALLPQYLFDKRKIVSLSNFSVKISRLVTQMIMTICIVAEYFPIYLVFFYFFGVLGLQMFGNLTPQKTPEQSSYSVFNQVANFQSFIFTQFYMVQILVQGGWSMVSFDYAYRYPLPQVITMLFFVSAHFSITLVVSSLIKGITWQVYQKIEQQTNIEQSRKLKKLKQQKQIKQTKQILETVRHQINLNQTLHLQNIISRQIYEQKADHEILKKMYQALSDQKNDFMLKKTQQNQRKNLIPLLIKDLNLFVDQIELFNNAQNKMQEISQILPNQRSVPYLLKQQQSLYQNQVNDLSQPNIDQQIQKLISKAIIDGKYSFTQTIIYPRLLTDFLQTKLKTLSQHNQQINIKNSTILQQQNKQKSQLLQQSYIIQSNFNITTDTFTKNTQSINFLTDSLKILLQMKTSQKQLKDKIISKLIETHTINQQQALLLLSKKKIQKSRDIGPNLILRRTFLANINERLVQKFQIQYFSNLYGKAFKQISQNTIQPLLRLQSKLTYCLRNALRYRQMSQLNFFNIINTIEDQISSKLLSKGSLLKFVYQIDSLNQTWFTIEVVQKSQVKVHFIKNGVWIWNKKMKQKEIYVADDLFYWKDLQQQQLLFNININSNQSKQPSSLNKNKQYLCERFIKMLYQSFQTLALCLPTQKNFFTAPNPQSKQYSFYSVYNNTEQIERTCQITKRFSISKIMLVCLVNQGKRRNINNQQQQLKYQLTDLKQSSSSSPQQPNKKYNFNINSTRKQALQKLQQFQTVQQEQISDQQKLPHAYIINLLQQIQHILQLGTNNFVYHIENLLNRNNNKDICIYNSYGNNTIKNTYLQRKNSLLYNKHINSHPNLNIHNNNNSMNNLNININLNRNRSNSNQNINNNNIINTSRSNSKNQYMTRQTSIIPNIQIQYSQSLSDNNSVYI